MKVGAALVGLLMSVVGTGALMVNGNKGVKKGFLLEKTGVKEAVMVAALTMLPMAALADGSTAKFTLPPIDTGNPNRCAFVSSAMGQANAARDKLYDLRLCDMSKKAAENFDLSGAILSDADFSQANFKDAKMSKAYARNSKFLGTDFTNAVVDRVSFDGSNMQGAIFANAVLTGTSFESADLQDVDFTDAFIGDFDLRKICKNPTLKGENPVTGAPTRESAGC